MIPYASNLQKEECSPISSNCIIWQGPDLPCLVLCKGDSISDVVYKLASQICSLKDSIGLSDLDLSCLVNVCQTTPEPVRTLSLILQLLADKICCLADIVSNLPDPGNNYSEPILNLPLCLQYADVTQLIHNQYTLRIATVLCSINTTVNSFATQLADLENRIDIEESAVSTVLTINSCLLDSVQNIDVVLENLETEYCAMEVVLGDPSVINLGMAKQCPLLNTDVQLADNSLPMSTLTGWENTVSTIGQSIGNIWLTICDIRSAIKIIHDTCCRIDCNSIIINYNYLWIDGNTLRLYFSPNTYVPPSFYDCNTTNGNTFTITDGLSNVTTIFIHFRKVPPDVTGLLDDVTNLLGYQRLDIDFTLLPLDVTTGLTITADVCFTNGDVTCIKCVTKDIAAYVAPTTTTSTTTTTTTSAP